MKRLRAGRGGRCKDSHPPGVCRSTPLEGSGITRGVCSMQFNLTPKRILAAVGLALLLGLQIVNNTLRGKGPAAAAIILAVLAFPLIVAVAFAVRQTEPDAPRTQFRSRMVLWLVIVMTLLLLFVALDAFHVPWMPYGR